MTILYESPWLLAVQKPAGLSVEKSPHHPSVEAWVEQYLARSVRQPFVGIIHRLDRPVSGVLLLAKKKAALKKLNEQFAQQQVQKSYLTLVEQAPPAPSGTLVHWLRKDLLHKKALIFNHLVKDSVECRLDYQVREKVGTFFLLEIQLHTGKFHQIRAQLAALGCPVLGDAKYGASRPYLPDAIALHAWRVAFQDPLTDALLLVEAPFDMAHLIK